MLRLDEPLARTHLNTVAPRNLASAGTLQLPLPNGELIELEVTDSPVMEPGLASAFSDFRT